jgi:hypothetical protein
LEDYLQPNNPYTSYNALMQQPNYQELILNRTTKINFLNNCESGDFRVATNNLALFPYHKVSLANSTSRNSNMAWSLGLEERHNEIKDPVVRSLEEEYLFRSENSVEMERTLFRLYNWEHIHIEIPFYKYWMIYVIQIFCPLLLLSAFTMFIFLQENGKADDGSSNIFNLRIANATAILLAYTAMIPVFKAQTAASTTLSFFYLIVYLAVLPLLLALISSVLDAHMTNTEW